MKVQTLITPMESQMFLVVGIWHVSLDKNASLKSSSQWPWASLSALEHPNRQLNPVYIFNGTLNRNDNTSRDILHCKKWHHLPYFSPRVDFPHHLAFSFLLKETNIGRVFVWSLPGLHHVSVQVFYSSICPEGWYAGKREKYACQNKWMY